MNPKEGIAWVYGDNIDTDRLFPGQYLDITEPKQMALHALEGLDNTFIHHVKSGDFIVAGKNFGCGSSREQAAAVLHELGVSAVVSLSFARIFYRNAINVGVPPIIAPKIVSVTEKGDHLRLDLEEGLIENISKGTNDKLPPSNLDYSLVRI